jgi:hypothetical protein
MALCGELSLSPCCLRRRILGISVGETSIARRGFRGGETGLRERIEQIGRIFLHGYHSALEEEEPVALALRLHAVEAESRGFAFEGAAMGLALLDHLMPWNRDLLRAFLDGPGSEHAYMVHVGAGWAFARLPWIRRNLERPLSRLDPLIRWLAVDGYGFHEGYFSWPRTVRGQAIPGRLSGYARRVFDQGLGRSLWFVDGADVDRIPKTIDAFDPSRHADLWSGVGLACAYAGGVDRAAIEALQMAGGPYRPQLAQGAAFAAKARQRAGNPADHTGLACAILCAMSAVEAARVTDDALVDLPADGPVPAYEVWRRRIRDRWTREAVTS